MVCSHGCRVWRGARITFETALSLIWFELDLNLMEGECKVGQAVSYCRDGVIALSCLPASLPAANSWLNERIFVQKKKKVAFVERLTLSVQAFPCLVSYWLPTKVWLFFFLIELILFIFPWSGCDLLMTAHLSAEAAERNSFKTQVRSGISLVLFVFGLLFTWWILVRLHFF